MFSGIPPEAQADAFGLSAGTYDIAFEFNDGGTIEGSGTISVGIDGLTAFDVSFPGIALQCTVCETLASDPDLVVGNLASQFVIQDTVPGEFPVLGMLEFGSTFALQIKDSGNIFDGAWSVTPVTEITEPATILLLMSGMATLGSRRAIRTRR